MAKPVSVDLYPKLAVLDGTGSTQQMVVKARYSDGTERDVTSLALFLSNNDTSAKIAPDGKVSAGERGEAFVMARFSAFTVGAQVIVLPKALQFTFPAVPEHNYIDTFVSAKLKKLRITPSELCSDEIFLRRAYLDIIGVLPTVEEHSRFMANPSPKKRDQLVDELLGRKEASRSTSTTSRSLSATSAPRGLTSSRPCPTRAISATRATSPGPASAASRPRRSTTASAR